MDKMTEKKQALILAGGLGTRLRSVVNDRPKPMALVEGKPFLEYVLNGLKNNGITSIIFAVGYKGSMVEEYFGDGSWLGMQIVYSYEEGQLGTAGAIKNAVDKISTEAFYVLNGDTYYEIDYGKLAELNRKNNSIMTLVLREVEDISRYGKATLQGEQLVGFNEKSTEDVPGTINGGIYYMKKELLDRIPEGKVSLENEIIPMLLAEGQSISGTINDGYFIDIGIPEDYFRFQEHVRKEL
jgi:D-glycero-alpha-D-manno-heptose 1-phosphate guanylyltransferase